MLQYLRIEIDYEEKMCL